MSCGRPRELVDVDAPHEQSLLFGQCAGCASGVDRKLTKSKKRRIAEVVVREADRGVGTLAQLAGELGGVAAQTVYRRARAVGVGVNPPAWGEYRGAKTGWFVAAGRLLLPFVAEPRTWPELERWASEQGWALEDARNLCCWLETKGDVRILREAGPVLPPLPDDVPDDRPGLRWWVVAAPADEDEAA